MSGLVSSPSRGASPFDAGLRGLAGGLLGVGLLSATSNLLMLTGPLFMLQIYDRVLASGSHSTLVALTLLAGGLYLLLGFFEILRSRVMLRLGRQFDATLSPATLHAALELPLRQRAGGVTQPLRDLDELRSFFSGAGPLSLFDLPWIPFFIGLLFLFHPWLGTLALGGALVVVAMTLANEFLTRDAVAWVARSGLSRSELLQAGCRNAESVRAMGMAPAFRDLWLQSHRSFLDAHRRACDLGAGFSGAIKALRLGLQSGVLALGAWLAIAQEISPGLMIAASILTARALAPVEQAVGQWRGFLSARQSGTRLAKILRELAPGPEPLPLKAPYRELSVEGLGVGAPKDNRVLLQDLRFSLPAGAGLGIVGPSGTGKSSLARTLAGIWPPRRGAVRLDGARLDQWRPEALGRHVGYLPQDVELFDGTVAQNIARLQADAPADQVVAAAEEAGAHEMILALPDGYNTQIGRDGGALSGGQRQRIGLARALYGAPFLVILDEPNANLDSEGEAALDAALRRARDRGAIVVVIAHRPAALAATDQVLLLQNGRKAAFGPRDQILRKNVRPAVLPSQKESA